MVFVVVGPPRLPPVADQYAQREVPRLHPPKRLQDDRGTAPGAEGQPPQVLLWLHRRIPQLLWRQGTLVTEHGHLYCFNVVKLDNHLFNFYEDKSFINEYLILTFWTNYYVDLIS